MRHENLAEGIRQRYATLSGIWNERQRRHWAAGEAKAAGYGGVTLVARVTGVSRRAIHAGLTELADDSTPGRVRRPGAGRKRLTETQPSLLAALDMLVPGAPKLGELVTLVLSIRTSTWSRSRMGNDLNTDRFKERVGGSRNSSKKRGSGETVYWLGRGTKALVSK